MTQPGVEIDLDHRDVRAERERGAVLLELRHRVQRLLRGELPPLERGRGYAGDADTAVVGDHDVVGVRLEHRGRDLAGAREHRLRRVEDRATAELERTRTTGTAAGGHRGRVGLHERDPFERDAEPVGDDHRERRGVALAVRRRPDVNGRGAVVVHRDAARTHRPRRPR